MNKLIIYISMLFLSSLALAESYDYREPLTSTISVSFEDNSSVFKPSPIVIALLDAAQDATMITIAGRTSTTQPSHKDEKLALARAISARDYLIENGVSPLKILINYISAADFIADNRTPEGRYLNQRVDIQMIYVPFQ